MIKAVLAVTGLEVMIESREMSQKDISIIPIGDVKNLVMAEEKKRNELFFFLKNHSDVSFYW